MDRLGPDKILKKDFFNIFVVITMSRLLKQKPGGITIRWRQLNYQTRATQL
jgi:hypothetical protein